MSRASILQSFAAVPVKGWCGSPIVPEARVLTVTSTGECTKLLFRDQIFCSEECLGAFCLEHLRTLDLIDTSASNAVVSDLHDLHQELAQILMAILDDSVERVRSLVGASRQDPPC
jgi:hypothetical protein